MAETKPERKDAKKSAKGTATGKASEIHGRGTSRDAGYNFEISAVCIFA